MVLNIYELRDRILSIEHYKKYIKKTRITKNGLFIYGDKYKTSSGDVYPIYTYISKVDIHETNYILDILDAFVDCEERLVKDYEY